MENKDYSLLSSINSPSDLENIENLDELCREIRSKLLEVVSDNGGHLSSNLGVVELTVALHKIFNSPDDKIIWDVSHQSYAHKMLTGRFNRIDTLRKKGGVSGFTNKNESEYDIFTEGHSSTSISAALGYAYSKKISKEKGHTIAVIGDGALTGGLAYEAINNVGRFKKNFIIILNDNKMSISKNVGAVARYLSAARIRPSYMKFKNMMEKILDKTSVGLNLKYLMKGFKTLVKKAVYKNSIFEDMGLAYYGPIDGHNLDHLQKALKIAKNLNKPTVVHVLTVKGKGCKYAEKDPGAYHAISGFNPVSGEKEKRFQKTFSDTFGDTLCEIAEKNDKICAITAAMTSGTGLTNFKKYYKKRFFDVGIAEEHAVTFAGGLAAGGMVPIFAVYSTFLQRSYDQLIHDVAMQNQKVILAVDRAGLTGEDGETHQGVFDVPFLRTIPGTTIFAPAFLSELDAMLRCAIDEKFGLIAVRYPRGSEFEKPNDYFYSGKSYDFYGNKNSENLVITYGRIFSNACIAQKNLKDDGIDFCVLKLNIINPIKEKIIDIIKNFKNVVFFEESEISGSISEFIGSKLMLEGYKGKYSVRAIDKGFIKHGSCSQQLEWFSLDVKGMERYIKEKGFR
ncbi:MAG: 1-deoxy-D-xylulose-5-phosphate synthase [Acutalibacteraceae bacterium]